jgi:hypothetical protein
MVKHPERKLLVEGGGNNEALKTECRRAFAKLLERAGLEDRKPRIVACGSRGHAFDQLWTAMASLVAGDVAVLLVDAEAPVTATSPWDHVKARPGDGWDKPGAATDDHLHLMVQCMESWFLADRDAMRRFFGQGFQESALPPATAKTEDVSKNDLYAKLEQATRSTKTKGARSASDMAPSPPPSRRMPVSWS